MPLLYCFSVALIQFHTAEIGACSWCAQLVGDENKFWGFWGGFFFVKVERAGRISAGTFRWGLLFESESRCSPALCRNTKKSGLQVSKCKASQRKAVFLVTAAVSSSCWCAVQRTRSWEWLNTSGSPWTLYWPMDTPLSTVREELKGRAEKSQTKALSLCLPLALRHTNLYTLSLIYLSSLNPECPERRGKKEPNRLFTCSHREYHSVLSPCSPPLSQPLSNIDFFFPFFLKDKTIYVQEKRSNVSMLLCFNQPQMHSRKQPLQPQQGLAVCLCLHPVVSPGCAVNPPAHPLTSSLSLLLDLSLSLFPN